MIKAINMLGRRIGKLTVVKKIERRDNASGQEWLCYYKREHHLGSFVTKEEAIAARIDGEEQYFKPLINKYKK